MSADRAARIDALIQSIEDAEALARRYDEACADQEAQQADESAEQARLAARALIEAALPGISWTRLRALA